MKHIKRRRSLKKPLLIAGGVVLVAAAVVAVLEATNTTHLFHRQKVAVRETASQNTKGETGESSSTTPAGSQSTSDTGNTQPPTPTSSTGTQQKEGGSTSATLITPTSNFVGNHHANLSSTESSVCTTTPGASCKTVFTNGSITTELPT